MRSKKGMIRFVMAHCASPAKSYMGHAATKPDKVNIGITKDFRDQNLVVSPVKPYPL